MKIIVLAGGLSPERDVSLSSGSLIANALIENGHEVMLLDLYLGQKNEYFPATYQTKKSKGKYFYRVPEQEPDLKKLKEMSHNGERLIGDGVIKLCQGADVVFLALHGSIGENGQLQAMFDTYGIHYTGTGYIGSLLAMDKDLSKQLLRAEGILTPDWIHIDLQTDYQEQIAQVELPCVVKPCSCGSSVGVTIVEEPEQLDQALENAKAYEQSVIIETKIVGREFSVGILDAEALPPIEIVPVAGFYDYKNKYQAGLTKEFCPASIRPEEDQKLRTATLEVHKKLRLGYYSRVDFILDKKGDVYCLEANTLPGMTPTSLLPQEAQAVGISYPELCEKLAFAAV